MPKKKKKKTEKKQKMYYEAVGRRKEATARVRLYPKKSGKVTIGDLKVKRGEIVINGKPIEQYFPGKVAKIKYTEPFKTTNTIGRFTILGLIKGSGKNGQLDAFIHGASRALEKVNRKKFRPILKKQGFLTRDARARERRKAGLAQSARAQKQSPKR